MLGKPDPCQIYFNSYPHTKWIFFFVRVQHGHTGWSVGREQLCRHHPRQPDQDQALQVQGRRLEYIHYNVHVIYIQLQHIEKDLCRSKGKVRLCCLGTKFIQFHAMLAILHPDCWKNMMNSSFSSFILVQLIFFFIPSWCKIASAARNSVPHTEATTFALYSVYVHCTMYMLYIYSAADYTMIQITANEN